MAEAKKQVIRSISKGARVAKAMEDVGRGVKTYEDWRRDDVEFRDRINQARGVRTNTVDRALRDDALTLSFAEWRKEYLGYDTYEHQQQWIDVLEGKEPQPLSGCDWTKANLNRVIINVPPGHSKSSTVTVDYATYKICMNPDVRICIISKRQEFAAKFLYQIKQRLTSTLFQHLQDTYAPKGGFRPEKGDGKFSANMFYVAGRKADQKDPTVEALGMGSSIYGGRYDLIIMDDCIALDNAGAYDKQIQWLESEVENRVKHGKIIIIGTRLASSDMYIELQNDERYLSGHSPWSYLRQPMVRKFSDDPKDWVTLWPRSTSGFDESDTDSERAADGTFTMWDGPTCSGVRDSKPPKIWALVYMQQQTSEDSAFSPICVQGSVDRRRKPSPLTAGAWGHPSGGKEGMYTIGSMDPAMAGDTFVTIGSVDRRDQKRWIEQCIVKTSPTPAWIRETIKSTTIEYGIQLWVIEKNAFQIFLTMDPEINLFLANLGVRLVPHYSGTNKADPDFGVASIAGLFGMSHRIQDGTGREVFIKDSNLLCLPDPDKSPGVKAMIEQLIAWEPGKRGSKLRQDGPMSLWFWELQARTILGVNDPNHKMQTHIALPHMMSGSSARRATTPMSNRLFGRR